MSDLAAEFAGIPDAAKALLEQGREAERAGHPEEARRTFERALRLLRREVDATAAAAILRWIAWTHAKCGDADAALDCLEVAEAAAQGAGDDRGLASALNTRAGTLFNLGELDQAEELFLRVRSLAWRIRDRKLQAMAEQNLGSVACIRGDLPLALRRFQSSLNGYESLGLDEYVGPLLNNIGRLQIDLGRTRDAEATLSRARALCLERGDEHHHIVIEVNRARLLLQTGRVRPALEAGEKARQLATTTGDDRWLADILLIIGSAHLRLSRPDLAMAFLEKAAGIARDRRDAKVLADVVLEQADACQALGRNPETLQCLNEAHRIFLRLRARRELADVDTRLHDLEATFLRIVQEWGESIESVDAYTQGHCSRVADLACLLAEASGFPEEEMTWFRMGALLHDVGKVEVPLSILNKPGPLDEEERDIMARHPVTGVELLQDVDFPWDIRPMVRHHHERWDGTGYPDRLAGEAIPTAARILTIADVYDALTTDRSYRPGFSHKVAMEILESEVEKTVDPELFRLFATRVVPVMGDLKGKDEEAELAAAG